MWISKKIKFFVDLFLGGPNLIFDGFQNTILTKFLKKEHVENAVLDIFGKF